MINWFPEEVAARFATVRRGKPGKGILWPVAQPSRKRGYSVPSSGLKASSRRRSRVK